MLVRTIAGILMVPVYLGVLLVIPVPIMAAVIAVLAMVAAFELLRAAGALQGHGAVFAVTALAAGTVPILYWLGLEGEGMPIVSIALVCALFLLGVFTYGRKGEVKTESILYSLYGGLLIPMFMSSLIQLRMMEHGRFLVLLPVISSVLTDVGAYFVGVLLGKHKGVTKVSPNKSAEGFVGGMLAGVLFMMAYGLVLRHAIELDVNMARLALYGFVGSVVTMLGDLSFSLIKRQYGVKDYGHLIPGHGGILDRFDSLTFAAPVALILVRLLPAL